jgi:hypothetical protein
VTKRERGDHTIREIRVGEDRSAVLDEVVADEAGPHDTHHEAPPHTVGDEHAHLLPQQAARADQADAGG